MASQCWICDKKGLDKKGEREVTLWLCNDCAENAWSKFLELMEVLIEIARERKDKKIPMIETWERDKT